MTPTTSPHSRTYSNRLFETASLKTALLNSPWLSSSTSLVSSKTRPLEHWSRTSPAFLPRSEKPCRLDGQQSGYSSSTSIDDIRVCWSSSKRICTLGPCTMDSMISAKCARAQQRNQTVPVCRSRLFKGSFRCYDVWPLWRQWSISEETRWIETDRQRKRSSRWLCEMLSSVNDAVPDWDERLPKLESDLDSRQTSTSVSKVERVCGEKECNLYL